MNAELTMVFESSFRLQTRYALSFKCMIFDVHVQACRNWRYREQRSAIVNLSPAFLDTSTQKFTYDFIYRTLAILFAVYYAEMAASRVFCSYG